MKDKDDLCVLSLVSNLVMLRIKFVYLRTLS